VFRKAIELSDKSKIKYVTLINHSDSNCCKERDGTLNYANKEYVIGRGVRWVDIPDQNGSHSATEGFKTEDMKHWAFIKKHPHGSWLYNRIDIVDDTDRWGETGDASDAGMMFFLLTGDKKGNVIKLQKWLDQLPQSVFPGADWEEKTPESQNLDSAKLGVALKYLAGVCGKDGTRRAVIIRNGYLIWKGDDIDNKHDVWSVSKSFTSTVFGLLIDDKKTTEDSLAQKYYPELKERYSKVKLSHFATMTSGYTSTSTGPDSWNPRLRSLKPDVPAYSPPGSKNSYHDPAMTMFAYLLTRISDSSMRDMFKTRVAEKIGMASDGWLWNSWTKENDKDVCYGHAGIFITARQLARFGHLYLNRGNWNGKQIISESWVDKATSLKVPLSVAWLGEGDDVAGQYGYNWWLNGIRRSGERKWPAAPLKTFVAAGHNNNMCFVVPEWNMVIVRMGLDGNTVDDDEYSNFFGKISAALLDPKND
jgi:CubicO group peptidase (beta-lactamase class C family)